VITGGEHLKSFQSTEIIETKLDDIDGIVQRKHVFQEELILIGKRKSKKVNQWY